MKKKYFNFVTSTQIEDPDQLPEPIRDLVGKSFCFGISVSSDNVTNGAETFKVLEVWSGNEILQVESQSEPNSMIGTSSSTMSSCDVSFFPILYIHRNVCIYLIL